MESKTFSESLSTFYEALRCNAEIHCWVYSAEGELLYTNYKYGFFAIAFKKTGCKDYALEYAKTHKHPLILSAGLGAMWCATPEYKNGSLHRLHVIGPIFTGDVSKDNILKALEPYEMQEETKINIVEQITKVPMMSTVIFFHDCTLFHYFVNKEKITSSDIHFQSTSKIPSPYSNASEIQQDRKKTYLVEKELLRMVKEGNLNYGDAFKNARMMSKGIRISTEQPIDQAKISCSSFVTLCTRAAIEGGLTPETAYTIGDNYIQAIYSCLNFSDLISISHTMYDDFVNRVNKKKKGPIYSNQVQSVIDYMKSHTQQKLSLEELSSLVFYSEAYLSRKFKDETGENVHEYFLKLKLQDAAFDLERGDNNVCDIAEKYHFSSSNHFSSCFKKEFGILPNQYKKEKIR